MTDAAAFNGGSRSRVAAVLTSPITLWGAFVVAHLVLGLLCLYAPGLPMGDVTLVYQWWVERGFSSGDWVGIDTAWVYPIAALLPMLAADAFGPGLYASTWLSLVMLVDAAAFAVLLSRGRAAAPAAWWWVGFLIALGPISLGRIDSITVPIAMAGMLFLATRPRLAGVLLAVATWIKVWPAALGAAAVVALRERLTVLTAAVVTSGIIVLTALILGGGGNVLSFVTMQTGRGMQIESPIATFWMWDAARRLPGGSSVYYDTGILTYQLHGPGVEVAAAIMTPLLAIVVAVLLVIALLAVRRGVDGAQLLAPLALAITVALILFNKVGSPQFVTWLAVPIVYGLVVSRRDFWVPAIFGLVIAGFTQLFYPYLYGALLGLRNDMLLALTTRNLLFVVLFAWAVVALIRTTRSARPE
jgi:hypothetical protein